MKKGELLFIIFAFFAILIFPTKNAFAGTWYECLTDSDCDISNSYPPYWFCDSNTCTNACTRNSDCRTGGFCGVTGGCIAKLGIRSNCNGVTFLHQLSEEDEACDTGFCDNDGKGNPDDYWCYSPVSTYLENQDNKCEYDINPSSFNFSCDELANGVDCSITVGRGYWCNLTCGRQNKDTSSLACLAGGLNCNYIAGQFSWITGGENKDVVQGQWEYQDTSAIECCGDDTQETNRSRFIGNCITNCDSNDYPSFSSSKTDKTCCDSSIDCVRNALCYSSSTTSSHTISGEKLVCDTGKFYDCDTSEIYCEAACDADWIKRGESSVGEYDSADKDECCEDDNNENFIESHSFQGHDPNDTKCCNGDDCVLNGVCQLSYQNGGRENIDSKCYNKIDDDCDGSTDFCDGKYSIGCTRTGCIGDGATCPFKGLDPDCASVITVTVKSISIPQVPLAGVDVRAMTMFKYHSFYSEIDFKNVTDANGRCKIVVYGNSSYDLVAQKDKYYMQANETKYLSLGSTWDVNLAMPLDVECKPDCTKVKNNLCSADCEGINGCHFYDATAKQICDNKAKYVIMSYNQTRNLECCDNAPAAKVSSNAPDVKIEGSSLIYRLTKPVWFRGKLVQMIIAVADKVAD